MMSSIVRMPVRMASAPAMMKTVKKNKCIAVWGYLNLVTVMTRRSRSVSVWYLRSSLNPIMLAML